MPAIAQTSNSQNSVIHEVIIGVEEMPQGQVAYKMKEYIQRLAMRR
jgi:hypothetical protein